MPGKFVSPKNLLKIFILVGLVIGVYMFNSVLIALLSDPNAGKYDRSEQGSEAEPWEDVELYELTFDPTAYLDVLLNSDLIANLSIEEKLDLMENMFGEDIGDYLDDMELTPDEFLDEFDDELGNMLESLGGGDSFSGDLLDSFDDPALVAVLLAKPVFYAAGNNGANPWTDNEDTLFKTKAFDRYDLTTYDWGEGSVGITGQYFPESDDTDRKFHIKMPIIVTEQNAINLYSNSPSPRILADSLAFDPIAPSADPALKSQSYLGGAWAETTFPLQYATQLTNVSYDLLYNDADHLSAAYYSGLGLSMADFTASSTVVTGCLRGPYNGEYNVPWSAFRNDNFYFDQVMTELEAYGPFTSASNTYDKMQAIVNFVGENFVYNPLGDARPGSEDEPIEWFCENRESQYPFEFSSLIVALARSNGISSRYVSGYKYNEILSSTLGLSSFFDPSDGLNYYPYLVGNIYTWVETFIPTASDGGDWVAFDNVFNAVPSIPDSPDDVQFVLQFDGTDYYPNPAGYERFDEFDAANSVDMTLTYEFDGDTMGSQLITLYDVTYEEEIDTSYTDSNGQITFALNLDELTVGPHVLNVSAEYYGFPIMNVTVLNILDDISIVSNIDDAIIVAGPNTPQNQGLSGYASDVYTGDFVANAELNFTGVKLATENEPIPSAFTVTPDSTVTGTSGTFSVSATVPGYISADWGSEYTIFTNFNGVFDISADIAKFAPEYQVLFGSFPTRLPAHLVAGYTDTKDETFLIYNDNYYEYHFYLNTTTFAHNTTLPTYSNDVLYGSRTDLVLNFTASLWEGYNYSAGTQVRVVDVTEGNRVVTTLLTDSNGYASQLLALSGENANDWTVGPHLLRMEWLTAPDVAETYFYVVIQDPVVVDQTSEIFTGGTGGLPALTNVYFINNGLGDPYDSFTVTGTMTDQGTGEALNNYIIYYQVIDKNNAAWSTSFLENGVLNETVTNVLAGYSETFNFYNLTALPLAPFRTDALFTGIFNMTGGFGWNSSWNALWMPYFQGLPTANDSSDGVIDLVNPSTYTFDAALNNVPIPILNGSTTVLERQFGISDSLNFSCLFQDEGVPLAGANLTLTNINQSTSLYGTTDADGEASFVVNFGFTNLTGINKFYFEVTYDNGLIVSTNYTYIEVFFNESKNFEFTGFVNGTDFAAVGGTLNVDSGSTLLIDGVFRLNAAGFQPATVILTDELNGTSWNLPTDANGYANFSLFYGSGIETGVRTYNLTVIYDGVAFDVVYERDLVVNFNPQSFYSISLWDSDDDLVKDSGDEILLGSYVTYNSLPFGGGQFSYRDLANASTVGLNNTPGLAERNLTIFYGSGITYGIHSYQLNYTFTDAYNYIITQTTTVDVNFNPASLYTYTPTDNVTSTTVGSGDQMYANMQVLKSGAPFNGGSTTLTDLTNISSNWVTGGVLGNYQFLTTFGAGLQIGVHTYLLNFTYTDAYGYYFESTYTISDVNFNPLSFYTFTHIDDITPIITAYQTVNFVTTFSYTGSSLNVDPTDATAYLIDYANRSMDDTQPVDGGGNSAFSLYFGEGILTGEHSITLHVNYTDAYGYQIYKEITGLICDFQPTEGYRFTPSIDVGNNAEIGLDEPFQISGLIEYNNSGTFEGVSGATMIWTHITESTTLNSILTGGTGAGSFIYTFDEAGHNAGNHQFKVNVSYNAAGFLVYFSQTYTINFIPGKGYTFEPWDSTGGASVGSDDSIDISVTFTNQGAPIGGVNVDLLDQTNPAISLTDATDGSGYANFTINFGPGNITGWHTFVMNITYTEPTYGYTFTNQTQVQIFFDETKNYVLGYTDTIVGSVGSDDTVDINTYFLSLTNPVANADVLIKDPNSITIASGTTDALGWANFTLTFGPGNVTGLQSYTIELTYDGITYTIDLQDSFDVDFDYTKNYALDITDDYTGLQYGADDTLQLDSQFLSLSNPVSGATITITDSIIGLLHSDTTDGNGWVNYTVNFGPGWTPGAHTITVAVSFDGSTYTFTDDIAYLIDFNETKNYNFVPLDSIDGITQTFGDSIDISGAFYVKGVGLTGADVTLTDLSNGTSWFDTTDGNGYVNFTINFNEQVYPGGHHYQMQLTYDGTTYTITDQSDHWVFYQTDLSLTAGLTGYTTNMTLDQVDPFEININGFLVDSNNAAHGHLDALLSVYIYEGITDVSDTFTYSFLVNSYNDNTDGAFDITLTITAAPQKGEYKVVVGFNGSLDVNLGSVGYTPDALPVNSSENLLFWVYQDTVLEFDYTIDNSGLPFPLNLQSSVIKGGSDITIFGNLTDSDGNGLTGENITLIIYNADGQIEATFNNLTVVDGYFEFYFENIDYEIDSIVIQFNGNYITLVNAADEVGGTIG